MGNTKLTNQSPQPKRPRFRMFPHLLMTGLLLSIAIYIRPDQLGVSIYNVSKITGAAWMAYMIDSHLFAFAWPRLDENTPRENYVMASRILARALIFIGAVYGFGSVG